MSQTTPEPMEALKPHDEMCQVALKWLHGTAGCIVAVTEITSASTYEIPDAIGWRGGKSLLIECKVSRSDFLADKYKPHRRADAKCMGDYRYYMAPKGMLSADEIPEGWGLLEVNGGRVSVAKGQHPNKFTYDAPPFNGSKHHESAILCSVIRRMREGCPYIDARLSVSLEAATPQAPADHIGETTEMVAAPPVLPSDEECAKAIFQKAYKADVTTEDSHTGSGFSVKIAAGLIAKHRTAHQTAAAPRTSAFSGAKSGISHETGKEITGKNIGIAATRNALTAEDEEILFGKVAPVGRSADKETTLEMLRELKTCGDMSEHTREEVKKIITALEAQPQAPASAVECAEAINRDCFKFLEDGPWIDIKRAAQLITAHTASAVAEARERALEEAIAACASQGVTNEHPNWQQVNGQTHACCAAIRELKGKEGGV
jgi:hypothetical protein